MINKNLNKIGIWTAIISFVVGTILLVLYYFSDSEIVAIVSVFYIIAAGVINFVILLALLIKSRKDSENRKKYFKTAGLILINIPIVLVYLYFIIGLSDTMRITFVNKTGKQIEDIEITGCEYEKINELKNNQSKTVWIDITGDCSITVKYKIEDKIKKETVFEYVTTSMGKKATYRIGKDKPID